ncbi:DUF4143 domain-containing protein [Methylibium sp.]|uniref:DUF4143 domain-containing protein n=1 Tax=Methylibium sp. TaxID=2067992 RepID=UPI003D126138
MMLKRQVQEAVERRLAQQQPNALLLDNAHRTPGRSAVAGLRGGYPLGHLAATAEASYACRQDFYAPSCSATCRSWEGFVVEQVAAQLPADAQMGFYRTAAGAELDLVIEHRSRKVGVEIKFSAASKPTKGFWQAIEDLAVDRAYVVAPVERRYPLSERVEVIPVARLSELFA